MVLELKKREQLSGIVESDPFISETETKRRNLLFVASLCILISVYGVKVKTVPWLEFEVPLGAPNILGGVLSVALIYTFLSYIVSAWVDLRRWRYAAVAVNLHSYFDPLLKISNSTHTINFVLNNPASNIPEPERRESFEKSCREALEAVSTANEYLKVVKNEHKALTFAQVVKVWLLDFGVAFSLGLFAVFKMGASLIPFVSVLVQ